jgi:cell division control protein 14 (SIN component)
MEALLSLAFDNLSSYDGPKIRKGLRQIEGLLAQICLANANASRPSTSSGGSPTKPNLHRRSKSQLSTLDQAANNDDGASAPKALGDLSGDPAFREFFKLQEGFQWNVALRLINTLDRLMAKSADGQNDLLILSALDTIQGVLLLHPPSKTLFSREQYMNVSRPAPAPPAPDPN